ncbi:MAG: 2-C-methyl-D-erythritol 4-phosphate cytidylyltransferase [Clostridiales Family XIII bacterium]|jgi:2-C-methyl-D-erythritol 4-phosphate cytidylyltransferase|nr:2-C-methyl-D-erythritol 4-phosphate cytidylyltransferase [Clostridiales Family XIII bacterium]
MNVTVILSGGSGVRFGGETPKQYQMLLGEEIIAYAVRAAKASALTDRILIVAQREHTERLAYAYGVECAEAGATHNASVKSALEYVKPRCPACENVLFADAARPFLTAERIDECFGLLEDCDAVITARRITDSLGREGEAFTDRSLYYLIQKPEAFRFRMLCERFDADSPCTAIAQQLPPEANVRKRFGTENNMKITHPEDLFLAETLMKRVREGRKA